MGSLGLPVLGMVRDTQNYIHLAARGLTLFDVAPGRVEKTWSNGAVSANGLANEHPLSLTRHGWRARCP